VKKRNWIGRKPRESRATPTRNSSFYNFSKGIQVRGVVLVIVYMRE